MIVRLMKMVEKTVSVCCCVSVIVTVLSLRFSRGEERLVEGLPRTKERQKEESKVVG